MWRKKINRTLGWSTKTKGFTPLVDFCPHKQSWNCCRYARYISTTSFCRAHCWENGKLFIFKASTPHSIEVINTVFKGTCINCSSGEQLRSLSVNLATICSEGDFLWLQSVPFSAFTLTARDLSRKNLLQSSSKNLVWVLACSTWSNPNNNRMCFIYCLWVTTSWRFTLTHLSSIDCIKRWSKCKMELTATSGSYTKSCK